MAAKKAENTEAEKEYAYKKAREDSPHEKQIIAHCYSTKNRFFLAGRCIAWDVLVRLDCILGLRLKRKHSNVREERNNSDRTLAAVAPATNPAAVATPAACSHKGQDGQNDSRDNAGEEHTDCQSH